MIYDMWFRTVTWLYKHQKIEIMNGASWRRKTSQTPQENAQFETSVKDTLKHGGALMSLLSSAPVTVDSRFSDMKPATLRCPRQHRKNSQQTSIRQAYHVKILQPGYAQILEHAELNSWIRHSLGIPMPRLHIRMGQTRRTERTQKTTYIFSTAKLKIRVRFFSITKLHPGNGEIWAFPLQSATLQNFGC